MKLSIKISVLASIIGIFFLLVIFTNTQHRIIGESKQHILENYTLNLQYLNNSFQSALQESTNLISAIAMMRSKLFDKNLPIIKKKLETHIKDISSINEITLISLDGKEIMIASKNRLNKKINSTISYLNTPMFKEVLQNKIYYSNVEFDQLTNEMIIILAKNITNPKTKQTIAVMMIRFSLENMKETITNKLTNGNGIALLDLNTNQFIYKSSAIDNIEQKYLTNNNLKNSSKIISQKDSEYLIVTKNFTFDRVKIKLIMANNVNNVFYYITNTFNINLLFLLISLFLLAVIMFFFIDYSLVPLKKLVENIQSLSKQVNTDDIDEPLKNTDEIINIQNHFNFFTELIANDRKKLELYNKTLEDRIEKEVKKNQEKERELAHHAKMSSMGEMIGNIAHQWRQPLSIISTIASGIKVEKEFGHFHDETLIPQMDAIVDQSLYLSKTIDDFRSFIKDQGKQKSFSTLGMLDKMLSLVKPTLKNNYIQLETIYDYDADINGYENELIQSFINIINNAKDAIKANTQDSDTKVIILKTSKLANTIEISIKDSGKGIDEKILSRIFEPYFTTKHQSVGTGIGLSMVDQIIREHNKGTITVSNEEFEYQGETLHGACFKITFPILN
jgi:signal transduction histidine kinase